MNRRSFINSILVSGISPLILGSAGRKWSKVGSLYVPALLPIFSGHIIPYKGEQVIMEHGNIFVPLHKYFTYASTVFVTRFGFRTETKLIP